MGDASLRLEMQANSTGCSSWGERPSAELT